jgi:hypothetical protein
MKSELDVSPYAAFTMALRSPITREKYLQRLQYFLSYLDIKEGNIEERCNALGKKAMLDSSWMTMSVMRYLQIHRKRMERREITAATLEFN